MYCKHTCTISVIESIMKRRDFLKVAVAFPAIVRAENLMKIFVFDNPINGYISDFAKSDLAKYAPNFANNDFTLEWWEKPDQKFEHLAVVKNDDKLLCYENGVLKPYSEKFKSVFSINVNQPYTSYLKVSTIARHTDTLEFNRFRNVAKR